jgi:hypothetical protein
MAVGPVAPWVVFLSCLVFLITIVTATLVSWRGGLTVDEIKGLEKDLAHWRL